MMGESENSFIMEIVAHSTYTQPFTQEQHNTKLIAQTGKRGPKNKYVELSRYFLLFNAGGNSF